MPQTFQVLRCYKCLVFQVHQTKKSIKWECKLCGEKQSIKRHYGLGTAKECRIHVQRLNGLRGEIDELKKKQDSGKSDSEDCSPPPSKNNYQPIKYSKWANYIEENMSLEGVEVVLEIPKKQRKQFDSNFKRLSKKMSVPLEEVDKNLNIYNNLCKLDTNDEENNIKTQSSKSDLQSEDQIIEKKYDNISKNKMKNKFIPPVLNKNSKWAQFTEEVEETVPDDTPPSPSIATSQNNLLFSLCDESDLDNVLNI